MILCLYTIAYLSFIYTSCLLTHSLLEILPKARFEGTRVVFWTLFCYKELKLTTNRPTGRTLHGLLIQMQNISLRSSGMRRKQNFVFGFKSETAVLTFTFRFLSILSSFFAFLASFFFSCWAFSRLHFGGNSF